MVAVMADSCGPRNPWLCAPSWPIAKRRSVSLGVSRDSPRFDGSSPFDWTISVVAPSIRSPRQLESRGAGQCLAGEIGADRLLKIAHQPPYSELSRGQQHGGPKERGTPVGDLEPELRHLRDAGNDRNAGAQRSEEASDHNGPRPPLLEEDAAPLDQVGMVL